ncbi:MAG TPA: deoxyribose-phosphate aldolase [Amycolatopsis sp.]|nr:deoxyribose-phosphate aldolase [Amycolatopsis sp.]
MTTVDSRPPAGFARDHADLREIRAHEPERIAALLAARTRRGFLPPDGRLMLVAADHPARGALTVRGDPQAMASRVELLDRLLEALSRPGVDGVLGTADILEDLLLLGALEDKVVVSSMNRGGLAGSVFEMDDRLTGYDVRGTVAAGFEAAKMLTRIDFRDPATVATLEACGAVTELNRAGVVALLEPFVTRRVDGRAVNDLSPEAVIRSVHIAQGLGSSSAYTWLKLPVVKEMDRVMAATTLPALLLGGDPATGPDETYESWRGALEQPGVRGLIVGRSLLYPPDDDIAAAVDTAASLVRPGAEVPA